MPVDEFKGIVRIQQLPEKAELNLNDLLVVENDTDTWKVKVSTFNKYIDSAVDDFKIELNDIIQDEMNKIQLKMDDISLLITEIKEKTKIFSDAEDIRVKNENDRIREETIRQKTYEEITAAENIRSANEDIRKANEEVRKSNENARIEAEKLRVAAENARKDAETNRGISETDRDNAEAIRVKNEKERVSNETSRVSNFTIMEDYFNALHVSVDNYGKEGISKKTTDTDKIVKILEVSIPVDAIDNYEALLHLGAISGADSVEGFFGISLSLIRNNAGALTDSALSLSFPDRYPFFLLNQFNACLSVAGEKATLILEYEAPAKNYTVKTSIVWDNSSMFKHDSVPIYSIAVRDSVPKVSFSSSGRIITDVDHHYSCPQGFITILDEIKSETEEIVANIKPYKSYPVGSIYQTTSTKNPSELLGGGIWKMLFGGGISENINIDGTDAYCPVIYTWERRS